MEAPKQNNIIQIKNWNKFQHYKHRNPPWIKLHNELLDNYEWSQLSDNSKLILFHLWMLASRYQNAIPNDPVFLKQKLPLKIKIDLTELQKNGFLLIKSNMSQNASTTLAQCKQNADPETETETETETENIYGEFKNVKLSKQDYNKINELTNNKADEWIRKLDEYIEQKGFQKKYKNHYLTIKNWFSKNNDVSQKKPLLILGDE